jgi:catechol 2,3-dioxygenase-like lactoylglutathione lyase family enzyme
LLRATDEDLAKATRMNIQKPHVSLNVTDIDAAVAFYEKAFGVPASKRRPGYAKFDLRAPMLNLTMQQEPPTGRNVSHLGIQVERTEDVLEARRTFEARGLRTFSEHDVSCCYSRQDKVWIEDPDGNQWEVFVVKGDADVMVATPAAGAAACCAPDSCSPSKADDGTR